MRRRIQPRDFMRMTSVPVMLLMTVSATSRLMPVQAEAANRRPSQEELRALLEHVVENQHRNDAALTEYERTERAVTLKSEANSPDVVREDKTYRVIPTGTGTIRVLVKHHDKAVEKSAYQKQLNGVARELERASNPHDSRQRPKVEKFNKRQKERTELVDAVLKAFRPAWLGHDVLNGRTLAKIQLDPDPEFKPRTRNATVFKHVRATMWVDEAAAQLVRMEGEITNDISFGGGVLGKIYAGGTFILEQAEVAHGVWLPTFQRFDFSGRKFLFGFSVRDRVETSNYRRVGPPREALAIIRRELRDSALPAKANSSHSP